MERLTGDFTVDARSCTETHDGPGANGIFAAVTGDFGFTVEKVVSKLYKTPSIAERISLGCSVCLCGRGGCVCVWVGRGR